MQEIECSQTLLKFKDYSRLQCMHGCSHYKRNPLCPPMCPDINEFKHYIERCQKVIILFEKIEYSDNFELSDKRNLFNTKLLEKEHRFKMDGKYYAVCFVSGACSMCEKEKCTSGRCKRVAVGRTPICATGIDLMHLTTKILDLSKEDTLSFMKQNLSKDYFDGNNNKYLCLGLILY